MKIVVLIVSFGLSSASLLAQLPNNDFETWTDHGNYMDPVGYLTPNSLTPMPPYPVQRSVDHEPINVGNYSMLVQNNTALLPMGGFGVALMNRSGLMNNGPGPGFPLNGAHPNSLTGYYKFDGLNNDTMVISLTIYDAGVPVSYASLVNDVPTNVWTPFNIDLTPYTNGDSASVMIAAFHAAGPPPEFVPHGNSSLWVDNFNFDVLITADVAKIEPSKQWNLAPNPASDQVNLSWDANAFQASELHFYDVAGRLVSCEKIHPGATSMTISTASLPEGFYWLDLLAVNGSKLINKLQVVH